MKQQKYVDNRPDGGHEADKKLRMKQLGIGDNTHGSNEEIPTRLFRY